jgi:hypothetical protein
VEATRKVIRPNCTLVKAPITVRNARVSAENYADPYAFWQLRYPEKRLGPVALRAHLSMGLPYQNYVGTRKRCSRQRAVEHHRAIMSKPIGMLETHDLVPSA